MGSMNGLRRLVLALVFASMVCVPGLAAAQSPSIAGSNTLQPVQFEAPQTGGGGVDIGRYVALGLGLAGGAWLARSYSQNPFLLGAAVVIGGLLGQIVYFGMFGLPQTGPARS